MPGRRNPSKGTKRGERQRRNIVQGRNNSPGWKTHLERCRQARELKQQIKDEIRKEKEAKRLLKKTTAEYIAAWKLKHAAELALERSRKISEARKKYLQTHDPWNKGVKAWNNGHYWPDEVRENISKGMIQYWKERKTEVAKEKQT